MPSPITGTPDPEALVGSSGDDVIYGLGGADTLDGLEGSDTLDGDDGDDVLRGGLHSDYLQGGAGGDLLEGDEGYDTLGGADTLDGGLGVDTLKGGAGNDLYYVDVAGDMVIENASAGTDTVYSYIETYTLTDNVEKGFIKLEEGASLTGNNESNILGGSGGLDSNDTLYGGGGIDAIYGDGENTASDTTVGGDDLIYGGDDGDHIRGQMGDDVLYGEEGNDTLYGDGAHASEGGNDTVYGGNGHDQLFGGAFNDLLFGGEGNDVLNGNAGDDTLSGGGGADVIYGGTGNDTFVFDVAPNGSVWDVLPDFNASVDVIVLNSGAFPAFASLGTLPTLYGPLDTLPANEAYIQLNDGVLYYDPDGSDGQNAVKFAEIGSASITAANIRIEANVINGDSGPNTLWGTAGVDHIHGSDGYDQIYGTGHDDVIYGGSGGDRIDGGAGVDTMYGGAGDDDFYVDNVGDEVNEGSAEGSDSIYTTVDYTLPANVENLYANWSLGLALTGNELSNSIAGDVGNDTLEGEQGNDSLYGSNGNNSLSGGAGDDKLYGGDDLDTLNGGSGDDLLVGGAGNDTYYVDSVNDIVEEQAGGGTDKLYTSVSYTLQTYVEEGYVSTGTGVWLTGSELDNKLFGNSGNDTLAGGAGVDQLRGGTGNDLFLFDSDLDSADSIHDFEDAVDKIALDKSLFTVFYKLGTLADSHFRAGNSATVLDEQDADDYLVYETNTGYLYYDEDGNGACEPVAVARIGLDGFTFEPAGLLFSHIEIVGTPPTSGDSANNVLTGTSDNDTLLGLEGDDSLSGEGSFDILDGGDGNDKLYGGEGNDTLYGGAGADEFVFDTYPDTDYNSDLIQDFETGVDRIVLSGAVYWAFEQVGQLDDEYFGAAAYDSDPYISYESVGNGIWSLSYDPDGDGEGYDPVVFATVRGSVAYSDIWIAPNVIEGGGSDDEISSGYGPDSIVGFGGNDSLYGAQGNDTLVGDTGDDVLYGEAGLDLLIGGDGNDHYHVHYLGDSETDEVIEAANGGHDTVYVLDSYTLPDQVEDGVIDISLHDINLVGNSLDNRLTGNSGNDFLSGAAGNDTLIGGYGYDTLKGGDGDDELVGTGSTVLASYADASAGVKVDLAIYGPQDTGAAGFDTLVDISDLEGSAYDDTLTGDRWHNHLYGGAGNDVLDGGEGGDELVGGAGADTFVFSNDGDADVIADFVAGEDKIQLEASIFTSLPIGPLNAANLRVVDSEVDALQVETPEQFLLYDSADGTLYYVPYGSEYDYRYPIAYLHDAEGELSASDFEVIHIRDGYPTAGNDSIVGTDDDDYLEGLAGNDTLSGGKGYDYLEGGAGDDLLYGGDDSDTLHGQAGNDELHGGESVDYLAGNEGDDTLYGDAGEDWIVGDEGNDTLYGGAGADILFGEDGNDALYGGDSHDWLYGGEDDDLLKGQNGDDMLQVSSLFGQYGFQYGNDTLDGGDGSDTLYFNYNYSDNLTIDLASSTLSISGGYTLTLVSIENIDGGEGDDHFTGNAANNALIGRWGNDTLIGNAGDDFLDGGEDDDSMVGGAGNDYYHVNSFGDVVIELEGEGHDTIYLDDVGDPYVMPDNVENLFIYTDANVSVTGNELDNYIGPGEGNSTIDGGAGADTVTYIESYYGVYIDLAFEEQGSIPPDEVTHTLRNIENVQGSAYEDTLHGDDGNNVVDGFMGDDRLYGHGGDDFIYENAGHDQIDGGEGSDTLSYAPGSNAVKVDLGNSGWQDTEGAGVDIIWNIENLIGTAYDDTLLGSSDDNMLQGLDGDDSIRGLDGNDSLYGGAGNDTLNGGSGADDFYFSSELAYAGVDTIADFTSGVDRLVFDNHYFTALLGIGQLAAGNFRSGAGITTAADANDYLIFNTIDRKLYYDADGSGGGHVPQLVAVLSSGTLFASDIVTFGHAITPVLGGDGSEVLSGTPHNDSLNGGGGNDTLNGGLGDDTLDGGSGNDVMNGGDGNDSYYVDSLADLVNETGSDPDVGGIDRVYSLLAAYTLPANVENGIILGSGTASITGNGLNNMLTAGAGDNVINGMGGFDIVSYYASTVGVNVSLNTTESQNTGFGHDTLFNIEGLHGSEHDDTLVGNADDNSFDGGGGNDVISGGDGNDTIYARSGSDSINGGDGVDTLNFSLLSGNLTVYLGIDYEYQDTGAAGDDLITGIENLYGGSGDDYFKGNSSRNYLYGGNGDDTLKGEDGDDTLQGGSGQDWLHGGSGVDRFVFNSTPGYDNYDVIEGFVPGEDRITLRSEMFTQLTYTGTLKENNFHAGSDAEDSDDYIIFDGTALYYDADGNGAGEKLKIALFTGGGTVVVTAADIEVNLPTLAGGSGPDLLVGADDSDYISGGAGNDVLDGGGGDDYIEGGDGDDELAGGSGNDTIHGGEGNDTVDYQDSNDNTVIEVGRGKTANDGTGGSDSLIDIENATGGATNDIIIGSSANNVLRGMGGHDVLHGFSGDDTLEGNDGNDQLDGGIGNDMLSGGDGVDTLIGGNGSDTFIFTETFTDAVDTIRDFVSGTDKIWLQTFGDMLTHVLAPEEFRLASEVEADSVNIRFIYDDATGILYVDEDGSGSSVAQPVLKLVGVPELSHGDITLKDLQNQQDS